MAGLIKVTDLAVVHATICFDFFCKDEKPVSQFRCMWSEAAI